MNDPSEATLRRFSRTLRVTLATALAEHELSRRTAAPLTRFTALAAKGVDAWRFPEDGLLSEDGLLVARLESDAAGAPRVLVLQAQGAAGLEALAGRSLSVGLGLDSRPAIFDRNGRAEIDLAGLALTHDDLASFRLDVEGDAS